jgi:hypothetical protein
MVGKSVISFLHSIALHRFCHVPIDSQGDTDRTMPQALLHDLGVDPHRDQDSSRAVAQIMETKYKGTREQTRKCIFDLTEDESAMKG